jgi:hypothetical protein
MLKASQQIIAPQNIKAWRIYPHISLDEVARHMTRGITEILDTDLVLQHPRQPILLLEVPIMALSAQFSLQLQCRH